MKIALIFDRNQVSTTGHYVNKELKLGGHETVIFLPEEIKKIPDYKPDLILAVDCGTHYICGIGVHPKAIWAIDTHLSYICDEVMIKSFDVVFVAQKNDSEKLKKKFKFVYWLPLAADPEFHGYIPSSKEYVLAMIGSPGRGRRKIIMEKLKKHYPDSYIGPGDYRRIGEIYSKSKIVVNYAIKNDVNMRIFEGLCSGSLLITNKLKNNGLEDLFEEGKDLVTYSGFADLKKKIDYYLEHEEERIKIGEAGKAKVLEKNKYKDRVDFMLSKINELRPQLTVPGGRKEDEFYFNKLKLELKFKKALWFMARVRRRIIWKVQELAS